VAGLWMAYQPIVRAADIVTVAYEALLRVEEPLLPHPGAVLRRSFDRWLGFAKTWARRLSRRASRRWRSETPWSRWAVISFKDTYLRGPGDRSPARWTSVTEKQSRRPGWIGYYAYELTRKEIKQDYNHIDACTMWL
jgi:hypothetical protein